MMERAKVSFHHFSGGKAMEEEKGLIFDFQSYSVHDGPGCRTTVFLSGCPLSCEWCANPESWKAKQQILFSKSKCRAENGCRLCIDTCKKAAIKIDASNGLSLDREKCSTCNTMECSSLCYNEALRICGKTYTVSEVMKVINRDRQFWRGKGGVTFSGGEPFFQKEFFLKLLIECKEAYIHTAIETSGYVASTSFLEAMKFVDFAFVDLKHMNRLEHFEKTGVYNDLILRNIVELVQSPWKGRIILRIPVIRDFNDTEGNILETIAFMKKLGLFEINLLPFHRMGDSKWNQLGEKYSYSKEEATTTDKLEELQNIFLDNDIACYIGHETIF